MAACRQMETATGFGSWQMRPERSIPVRNRPRTPRPGGAVPLFVPVGEALPVLHFTVPAPQRLAQRLVSAAIVRDAAGLGALVLFGTMLALVL